MSIVWARDSEGSEWGSVSFYDGRKPEIRKVKSPPLNISSNKEGYLGNPTSFIDLNDPRVSAYQRRYSEHGRRVFRENMDLVGGLIQRGIVMPTESLARKSVEKLKAIASGKSSG